jgi:hypothetical protein
MGRVSAVHNLFRRSDRNNGEPVVADVDKSLNLDAFGRSKRVFTMSGDDDSLEDDSEDGS